MTLSHRIGTLPTTSRPRAGWALRCGFVVLRPSCSLVRARRFAALGAPTVFLVPRSRTVVDPAFSRATPSSTRSPMLCNRSPAADLHLPRLPPAAGRPSSDGVPFPHPQHRLPTAPARLPPASSSSSPSQRSPYALQSLACRPIASAAPSPSHRGGKGIPPTEDLSRGHSTDFSPHPRTLPAT